MKSKIFSQFFISWALPFITTSVFGLVTIAEVKRLTKENASLKERIDSIGEYKFIEYERGKLEQKLEVRYDTTKSDTFVIVKTVEGIKYIPYYRIMPKQMDSDQVTSRYSGSGIMDLKKMRDTITLTNDEAAAINQIILKRNKKSN